jgi:N,N-dimethylformamidase
MILTGYLDRLSARPGDTVRLYASSEADEVEVDLVRLVHGDANPRGPGFVTRPVEDPPRIRVHAAVQQSFPGSFLLAEALLLQPRQLSLSVVAWPTLPCDGREQGLISIVGADGERVFSVGLDASGHVTVRGNSEQVFARSARPLYGRRWYKIDCSTDLALTKLVVAPVLPLVDEGTDESTSTRAVDLTAASGVLAAASSVSYVGARLRADGLYNGKLERPTVAVDGNVVAEWAFEQDMDRSVAVDVSGNDAHATLVNFPARAMTGHGWTGERERWDTDRTDHGAIHFHADDILDVGWQETAQLAIPASLGSGMYAVRLRTGDFFDHIPLAVLPPRGRTTATLAYLIPTFTYVAYANERLSEGVDFFDAGMTDHEIVNSSGDELVQGHPEWGASLYDHHADGSGVAYSSHLRPIPNLRPDYRMWLQNAPRHLAADLYLISFLERFGISYDVITDHDLDDESDDLLDGYQVVATGTHPEYHSGNILDAFDTHVAHGGSVMYVGGNGFYWVTTRSPNRPDVLEVRRAGGIRTWEAQAGERYHATTGELGGLWRHRGRSPNRLLGVGMCAQGWDAKAPGYVRSPASYRPEWSWVFEGVDGEVIGNFGLVMDGACGDEIDRFDAAHGSPPTAVVLASSQQHSDFYQLAVEDTFFVHAGLGGSTCPDVRSDMVLVEQASGGAVFSASSICFTGCLPINDFENNVSRLLRNVTRNLSERGHKAYNPNNQYRPAFI